MDASGVLAQVASEPSLDAVLGDFGAGPVVAWTQADRVVAGGLDIVAGRVDLAGAWAQELTGDGVDDLLLWEPGGIYLAAGDGLGGVGAPSLVVAATDPVSVRLRDLDGDGGQDLLWVDGDDVWVAMDDGTGWPAPIVAATGGGTHWVDAVDWDDDGDRDVVWGDDAEVAVAPYDPVAGTFGAPRTIEPAVSSLRGLVGDANDDGLDDLMYLDDGMVMTILNPAGSFSWPVRVTPTTDLPLPGEALDVGDWDGDGFDDLMVVDTVLHRVDATATWTYAGELAGDILAVLDVDGDGDLDAVGQEVDYTSYPRWRPLETCFRDGSVCTAGAPSSYTRPASLAKGDLDGDGSDDIVFGDDANLAYYGYDGDVGWVTIEPDGTSTLRILTGGRDQRFVVATDDLDADGDLDVLVGSDATSFSYDSGVGATFSCVAELEVHTNDGTGTFAVSAYPGVCAEDVASIDLDGDGQRELLAVTWDALTVFDDTLDRDVRQRVDTPYGANLRVADMDGDGDEDVIVGVRQGEVLYLENVAGCLLDAVPIGGDGEDVEVLDFDRDGLLDVVALDRSALVALHNPGLVPTPYSPATVCAPPIETADTGAGPGDSGIGDTGVPDSALPLDSATDTADTGSTSDTGLAADTDTDTDADADADTDTDTDTDADTDADTGMAADNGAEASDGKEGCGCMAAGSSEETLLHAFASLTRRR